MSDPQAHAASTPTPIPTPENFPVQWDDPHYVGAMKENGEKARAEVRRMDALEQTVGATVNAARQQAPEDSSCDDGFRHADLPRSSAA